MTTERVTYRPEGGRSRTIYLERCTETTIAGARCLTGIEVNKEGDEIAPRGVDERRHIIDLSLVSKRAPVVMHREYGEYVDA